MKTFLLIAGTVVNTTLIALGAVLLTLGGTAGALARAGLHDTAALLADDTATGTLALGIGIAGTLAHAIATALAIRDTGATEHWTTDA
jgi:hypothetical protein